MRGFRGQGQVNATHQAAWAQLEDQGDEYEPLLCEQAKNRGTGSGEHYE